MGYNLLELQQRVKALSENHDMARYLFGLIEETPSIIMIPQKEQLFRDSIGSDGAALGFYKKSYIQGKWNEDFQASTTSKNEGDPYNMVWSRTFYDGMEIEVEDLRAILTSTSRYLDKMLANRNFNTNNFFGLTDDNLRKVIDKYLYPALMKAIRKHTLRIS